MMTDGVGVTEGGRVIPENCWGTGVEWPLGVWVMAAEVMGGPLMTDAEGTRPGKTGVMGVVGGGWADAGWEGTGVDGVEGLEPWGDMVGVAEEVWFCWLAGREKAEQRRARTSQYTRNTLRFLPQPCSKHNTTHASLLFFLNNQGRSNLQG